jgi:hypothetical protein
MSGKKPASDSAYWLAEKECQRIQALVAMNHAKRGGQAVLMTGKKLTAEQQDELAAAGVEVIATR